jgi:dephospho-CoA kinase
MIIGVGHVARVGKDEVAKILVEHHGFTRLAFADALKQLVYETQPEVRAMVDRVGWEQGKTVYPDHVRKPLVDVGNAARRILGENVWVNAVAAQVEPGRDYVIPDTRYMNEIRWVQKHCGANGFGYVVKVNRPGVEALPNVADQALANWDGWDGVIENDGSLSDLKVKVEKLLQEVA